MRLFRAVPMTLAAGLPLAAALMLSTAACDDAGEGLSEEEAPLSDLAVLLEGAPDPDKLPDEPKSDAVYPKQFDLVALQSPVRNQASRGVCSIFSTVALMEHLYIKEGTLKSPDFSEQYLQWSVKTEVGAYTKTEGSNADRNIEAIFRFGIVDETAWPYQTSRWNTSHDARCTGEDQPVVCYTNGEPTDTAKAAAKWKLPRARWVANRRQSIKAFMAQNKQAVIAGMPFYYQSWNHRGGGLPVNSSYSRKGYILFPNAKDIEVSEAKPAGHSILIVGWDDDLEVPTVDGDGKVVMDEDGKPVTEKGFFLIKNSWGTGSFGSENPFGAGYGWLSMAYVERYANLNGADVPSLDLGPEACDDGVDNNGDGLVDCEETDSCGTAAACETAAKVFEVKPGASIPDNDADGITRELDVTLGGAATEVWVEVDIQHPFVRDLELVLTIPSGAEVTLYDRDDHSGRDMRRRFLLPKLVGEEVGGTWKLQVIDHAQGDTGKLKRFAVGVSAEAVAQVEICGDGLDNDHNGAADCLDAACAETPACASSGPATLTEMSDATVAIPDQDPAGAKSVITLADDGTITSVSVDVEISHSYRGDLTVALIHPDGTVATLVDQQGGGDDDIVETFTTEAFNGKRSAGAWSLWAIDHFTGDVGQIEAWILEVDVR